MIAKRSVFFIVCALIAAMSFGDAVISEFRGKVQVRAAGGEWRDAEDGMHVSLEDTISTGFNSTAVLALGSNNVIVSPLTRMTLDAFLEREGTVDTKLFLQVGAVRAKVDDSGTKKQIFSISSPYSTASVRGTEFSFDGLNLKVFEGSVAFLIKRLIRLQQGGVGGGGGGDDDDDGDDTGGEVVVDQGQSIQLDVDFSSGTATTTVTAPDTDFTTDPSSNGSGGGGSSSGDDGGGAGAGQTGTSIPTTKGAVTVTWEWED